MPPSCRVAQALAETVRRECELLGLPRASFYYEPVGERTENLLLMRLFQPVSQLAVCSAAGHLTGCGACISFFFEVEMPQDRAPAVAQADPALHSGGCRYW